MSDHLYGVSRDMGVGVVLGKIYSCIEHSYSEAVKSLTSGESSGRWVQELCWVNSTVALTTAPARRSGHYQWGVSRQMGVGVVLGPQDVCQLGVGEHVHSCQSASHHAPQLGQQAVLQQLLRP